MALKRISGQAILDLLKQGYVRFKKDDDGNGLGSVEEETGLSIAALKEILAHPRLKNIRVKVPTYIFLDDFAPIEEGEEDEVELEDDFTDVPVVQVEIPAPIEAFVPVIPESTTEEVLETIMENATTEENALFA